MAEKKGGKISRLWNKNGGGFYAAVSVVSFIYLETSDLIQSVQQAEDVPDFVVGELITLGLETIMNSFFASIWPIYWFREFGVWTLYAAVGGYLLWVSVIAVVLNRREQALRKELGL